MSGPPADAYAAMLQHQGDLVAGLFKARGLFSGHPREAEGPAPR